MVTLREEYRRMKRLWREPQRLPNPIFKSLHGTHIHFCPRIWWPGQVSPAHVTDVTEQWSHSRPLRASVRGSDRPRTGVSGTGPTAARGPRTSVSGPRGSRDGPHRLSQSPASPRPPRGAARPATHADGDPQHSVAVIAVQLAGLLVTLDASVLAGARGRGGGRGRRHPFRAPLARSPRVEVPLAGPGPTPPTGAHLRAAAAGASGSAARGRQTPRRKRAPRGA